MTQEFGERLARIEEKVGTVLDHVQRINGRVSTHDEAIATIEIKCGAHDAMTIGRVREHIEIDHRLADVDREIQSLRESRVAEVSAGRTLRENGTFVVVLATLLMTVYSLYLSHATAQAQQRPSSPAPQHQVK